MNKINYQRKLDEVIRQVVQSEKVPSLLLHSCCAPCSSYTLEYLSEFFNITVLYYNPNIAPKGEYEYRVAEQERLINEMKSKNPIRLIRGDYLPEIFLDAVKGFEKEPEGGKRCRICYRLRMEEAARIASEMNFDFFTTTLTISPLKDSAVINTIGDELSQTYKVKHLPSDFKKKGGYQRSIELSKEHHLYRQNFCGCVFSHQKDEPFNIKNGRLRVRDGKLVNKNGTPIQLRGMSTHGLAWNPDTYNEDSLKTLVTDWHISVFRIAVYTHEWGGYCTDEWKSKDEYHKTIDELIAICKKLGIYCIIDWHILNEGSGNPNITIEDARRFWTYMAAKHKNDTHILYEICNEPNGKDVGWSEVKKYTDDIIPLIRSIDPETVIICGTPTWSQDVDEAAENPLHYENLMYALHFYSGTHAEELRRKADIAISKGMAIFVTEFGTSQASGDGGVFTEECDRWMEWMNKNHVSWVNWSFSDKPETSAALKSNAASRKEWNDSSESGEYIRKQLHKQTYSSDHINS